MRKQKIYQEILKFAKDSKPSLLFQTYLKMLLEYSQRRSKLEGKAFDEIVKQLNPDKNMATAFKTIFDIAEEEATKIGMKKGMEKGIAIGEANVNKKMEHTKYRMIELLIQNTLLKDTEIAQELDVSVDLVKVIRLKFKKAK